MDSETVISVPNDDITSKYDAESSTVHLRGKQPS
jgi:hypothetical protein